MKKLSTILCTLALLFGAVGGVRVFAAKTIGKEFTSVASLVGKTFAIVNKTEGKAICNKQKNSPFDLQYLPYADAFEEYDKGGYLFKIVQINDESDAEANGKYLIRCLKGDGNEYSNGGDPYFQTNIEGNGVCFFFSLSFGQTVRGLDANNTAAWDIQYDTEHKGFTLKNVYTGKYYNIPTKEAMFDSPAYYTFCEVKEKEVVDQNVEISVGGETRNFQLYVPDKDLTNCPLVISLHGAGGHSTDYSPFRKVVADEANYIVAYPQGKDIYFPVFNGNVPGWDASGEDNADVAFLKAVIEDVASKYQIDRKRIYCCGFSNGGMMTYAMANACSDEIAAFAAISGYPINEFHLRHTGERPVPFLHIHGKADEFVLYDKVPTIVDEMVARLGANPVPTTTAGSGYTKNVYAAGNGSFPYVYYEIDGMGHNDYTTKTEDGSSAKTMWNFFKDYTLDSECDETLKWAPCIETAGFVPASHGWTVNDGTTLLQFGGDQSTNENQNVYHSLQLDNGNYKLSFKSTGAAGKTVGVKIEKLTTPNTVVLNTTVNVGVDAELPFTVSDGWGEYKLTMTRPSASDAITITDLVVTQTGAASKKELTPTGSTFVTQTYTKFSASAAPELAFDINPFEKGDWEKFVIELASPTTYADWLLCNRPTPYWNGGWWDEIDPGTSGNIELDLTNGSRDFGRLCLQAGDPSGYREIIVKDIYVSKESGATKSSILSSISGGTEVTVEEASAAGVKAFDMTNVDVFGYQKLVIAFTSPTIGQWVLNIDGTNQTIPAGTQYYKVDVSGKTTLGTLALSVGNDELPRVNNFDKLYLSNPVSISSDADWTTFADRVNGGETDLDAVLTADINAGSTMVGTDADGKRYTGTFDGAGHTLTFTYSGGDQFVAPFRCIENATIVDLLTTGSITTSNNMPGGFVGKNVGNSTLTRCGSSMTLTTTDSDNGRIGGLVGRCADGNQMTFNNCMYNGAISTAKSGYACGFVGWDNQANKITLNNCLVASTSITGGGQNFINQTPIIPNGKYAIYTTKFGTSSQGTQATAAQLATGEIAYTLNSDITDGVLFFGQGKLNSSTVEATPTLTSIASKKVVKTYKGETNFYSNPGGLLPDPALAKMLSWKFAMSGEAPYQTHLPAEQTTDREIYGSPDAYILVIGNAGASTFVFPFTTDGLPSGVKAYDLTFDGSGINATEVNKITADKPVLINAEAGTYKFESKLNWWESVDFSTHTETTNGALTGVYNTTLPYSYVPAGAYVLQNAANGLGFYQVENENTIKITSFRAYLTAPSSARMINIVYTDNETTAISEVEDKTDGDASIHSLSGQLVKKAAKGIYVKNGKKVIIK